MIQDVNVILVDMPPRISAYTIRNIDFSYTIVLNARLSYEKQLDSYHHELNHIENGDCDRKGSADVIEFYAHT